jgi:hypothetical protein
MSRIYFCFEKKHSDTDASTWNLKTDACIKPKYSSGSALGFLRDLFKYLEGPNQISILTSEKIKEISADVVKRYHSSFWRRFLNKIRIFF